MDKDLSKDELATAAREDTGPRGTVLPYAVFIKEKNVSRARDVVKQRLVKVEGTDEVRTMPDVVARGRHKAYWRIDFLDPTGSAYAHVDKSYVDWLVDNYEYVCHGGEFVTNRGHNPHLAACKAVLDRRKAQIDQQKELEELRKLKAKADVSNSKRQEN